MKQGQIDRLMDNSGLAEIPEERPSAEDASHPGNLNNSGSFHETNRLMLSPNEAVSAFAVVPSAFSPIEATGATKPQGSMREIKKHAPSSLFRHNTESMPDNQFFSEKNTSSNEMKRSLQI